MTDDRHHGTHITERCVSLHALARWFQRTSQAGEPLLHEDVRALYV